MHMQPRFNVPQVPEPPLSATQAAAFNVLDVRNLPSSSHQNQAYLTTSHATTFSSNRQGGDPFKPHSDTMSATTNPDPEQGAPAFIPLEANPELMTKLIHKLGVSQALQLHDVYSLTDPDMLAFIPRPALALLLVFPITAVYESHRMAEDNTVDEYKGAGEQEPVIWWKQTIRNACGMMGLLHAVSNGPARTLIGKRYSGNPPQAAC